MTQSHIFAGGSCLSDIDSSSGNSWNLSCCAKPDILQINVEFPDDNWNCVGPWGRIACLAHNVIGSHPGECDCCAEPPSGTVALLFQPVNTLNAVREPRQAPVAILSGGFVLSSGPSSAPTKHRRTELAF
ncbi:hypothetical protein Q7C36_010360 [Tachysurus vachellii]|uniref:Uncharacterized protein n=1 Tax=Tachysurus vachellii TaxID=175792 RepID=A0AA88SNL6_TACVA|nr:hypothetical protein Q7C36_010360 [Tachysurus vachellii]